MRGAATLPFGTGKSVRVGVFASDEAADMARSAGALWCGQLQRCRTSRSCSQSSHPEAVKAPRRGSAQRGAVAKTLTRAARQRLRHRKGGPLGCGKHGTGSV